MLTLVKVGQTDHINIWNLFLITRIRRHGLEFILHSCIVDVKQLTADIDSFSPAFDIIWARYGHFFDKFQTRRDILATFSNVWGSGDRLHTALLRFLKMFRSQKSASTHHPPSARLRSENNFRCTSWKNLKLMMLFQHTRQYLMTQVSGDNQTDVQFRTRAASAGQQAKAHVSQVPSWSWWWRWWSWWCSWCYLATVKIKVVVSEIWMWRKHLHIFWRCHLKWHQFAQTRLSFFRL